MLNAYTNPNEIPYLSNSIVEDRIATLQELIDMVDYSRFDGTADIYDAINYDLIEAHIYGYQYLLDNESEY